MRVGIDLVQISRFEKKFQENKKYFEEKVFLTQELSDARIVHLAGIFAAKEAVVKALRIKAGLWQEISIDKEEDGRPFISKIPKKYEKFQSDLSISHEGDYAIAFVVFYE